METKRQVTRCEEVTEQAEAERDRESGDEAKRSRERGESAWCTAYRYCA